LWEANTYLQKNLTKDPNNKKKAICKPCRDFKGGKLSLYWSSLLDHLCSKKHTTIVKAQDLPLLQDALSFLRNPKELIANQTQEEIEGNNHDEYKEEEKHESQNSSNSELKFNLQYSYRFELMKFIMKEKLPFEFAEKFTIFLKDLLLSYKAKDLSNFTTSRKNIANMILCIGQLYKAKYLKIFESTPFSIAIDEGSTKMSESYLAVNARFMIGNDSVETKTKLLGLIKLGNS